MTDPEGNGSGPLHLAHCFFELGVMYSRELMAGLGAFALKIAECDGWPDDDLEDRVIQSERWQQS